MDRQRFLDAVERVQNSPQGGKGIGTLSEKTVHAALKAYFEPYEGSHEQKIGGYVADIVGEDGIIEIQTRDLRRLRAKLTWFLSASRVTVVYPAVRYKWIVKKDADGSIKKRKSPKKGSPLAVLEELYAIKDLIKNENFSLCVCYLDIEEHVSVCGKRVNKERVPVDIIDEIHIKGSDDWVKLIPPGLGDTFTSADFARCGGVPRKTAGTALNVLNGAGAVQRVGKDRGAFVYKAGTL